MKTFIMILSVMSIVAGNLLLTGCERQTPPQRTEVEQQDDQNITAAVTTALNNSPNFKFPDVQVTTYKGKVQLSGFVLTSDQKKSADDIAKTTPGVLEIENKISIKR